MSAAPMPRHLILIKHAAPTIVPGEAAATWTLSAAGRASCAALARRLAPYPVAAMAASDDPKAHDTAERVAATLGIACPLALDHDLREHERRADDFFSEQDQFQAAVRDLFARPDDLVFGAETSSAARERFAAAVARHLAATPVGDLAIVAHGTVISLFVAAHNVVAPFPLWESLGLPSFVVLGLPDFRLLATVGSLNTP
jgi:broad specificity phosphatase PhoE